MLTGIVTTSCFIWIGLLLFRHRFWHANQRLEHTVSALTQLNNWPIVLVVIPARNEEAVLGRTLPTILGQDYPGLYQVILVDDDSSDGTSIVAQAISGSDIPITFIHNTSLPESWTGKLWAMMQGLQKSDVLGIKARYVLFTDADIAYAPWVLRSLVYKAEKEKQQLVSIMATLHCQSAWERLLVPAFIFFFQKLYPFTSINNPRKKLAGAAGGCMLVRRDTLRKLGDLVLVRNSIIDDCTLARLVKAQGSIWIGLSTAVQSLHSYDSLSGFWSMVARTAFAQLEYKISNLIITVIGMSVIYLVGPLTLISGIVTETQNIILGCIAWVLMTIAYKPTCTLYRRPGWECLILPLTACLYTLMTLDSVRQFQIGSGGKWKGRTHYLYTLNAKSSAVSSLVIQSRTSFLLAMILLSYRKRLAMFAIYAFCRTIDDIADDITSLEERLVGLASWKDEFLLLYKGKSYHDVALMLERVSSLFGLCYDDYTEIIDGMEMDASKPLQAPLLTTLDLYCDRVASAVGRLSVRVFGLPFLEGKHLSHTLGRALQMANILRDIEEDAKRSRLYLPCELFRLHGITRDLPTVRVLQHPIFPQVCVTFESIAYYYFNTSEEQLACCPSWRSRPANFMKAIYQAYFSHFQLKNMAHISKFKKFILVFCNTF